MSESTPKPAVKPATLPSTPSSSAPAATTTPAAKTGIQNGKGDAPRNISKKFRANYDGINWGHKK